MTGSNVTDTRPENVPGLLTLQKQVDKLKSQIEDLSTGIKHLADANFEMSKDMQRIYVSLKEISGLLTEEEYVDPDDPLNSMMMSFFPKKDDDLPN